MMSHRRFAMALVAAAALAVVAGAVFGVGLTSASHGPDDGDFTVEPMEPEDRQPGATNVRYGQIVIASAGVDLETLEETTAIYEEGSFDNCGPDDGEVFGIDRGNTNDGYEIDESLEPNVQRFSTGPDIFEVEFYGEDDFGGESTHYNDGDAFISVAQCMDNPDDPGWYQISGTTTGVTEDGERESFGSESHYFWICDCEDEEEARETLGPPPSEPEQTPTPTPEPADEDGDESDDSGGEDGTDGSDGNSDSDGSGSSDADSEDTGDSTTPTPTATVEPTPTPEPTATPEPTPTPTEAQWDVVQTPTPGDGPGFGPGVAIAALLGAALLFRRRT